LHHPLFFLVEKVCVAGVVWQSEPDPHGDEHAEASFDDVHPSAMVSNTLQQEEKKGEIPPASLARHAIHLQQPIG
jgi:hypothetical protein